MASFRNRRAISRCRREYAAVSACPVPARSTLAPEIELTRALVLLGPTRRRYAWAEIERRLSRSYGHALPPRARAYVREAIGTVQFARADRSWPRAAAAWATRRAVCAALDALDREQVAV
jgi:hypothetical protein